MSSINIAGNVSGTVSLSAPDVAGTTVLTLPATSGTVLTTTGGVAPGTSGNVLTSNGTSWISATPAVEYAGFNTVLFAASGTWTVPTGITKARVTVVGGGSGGFTSATAEIGGFGGFAQAYITGLSGSVTITVGLGSNEATAGSSTAGGTTSFGSYISATGGGSASSGVIGVGGTGTVTTGTALRTGTVGPNSSGLFLLGGLATTNSTSSTVAIVWSPASTFAAGKCGGSTVGGGGSVGGLVIIEY